MVDGAKTEENQTKEIELRELIDKVGSYIIIGFIFQTALFKVSLIWLNFLPITIVSPFYITHLYSLYVCMRLTAIKQSESPRYTIAQIYSDLSQKMSYNYLYNQFFPTQEDSGGRLLPVSFCEQALKYLFAMVLLYHIPETLTILAAYIIICLNNGKTHADGLINAPMLVLSSLFGLLLQSISPVTMLLLTMLSVTYATILFTPDNPAKDPAQPFTERISIALEQAIEEYKTLKGSELLIFTLCVATLASPLICYIPFISSVGFAAISHSALFIQAFITNIILGSQLKLFFSKEDDDSASQIPSLEEFTAEYASKLYAQVGPIFANACVPPYLFNLFHPSI